MKTGDCRWSMNHLHPFRCSRCPGASDHRAGIVVVVMHRRRRRHRLHLGLLGYCQQLPKLRPNCEELPKLNKITPTDVDQSIRLIYLLRN